jgi:hypothetical protein
MLLTEDLSDNEINDYDSKQENNERIEYFTKNRKKNVYTKTDRFKQLI